MEKRQARKFRDPRSRDHQPCMADSREGSRAEREPPRLRAGPLGIISVAAINPAPFTPYLRGSL